MAAIRALSLVSALLGFFLIGAPLQWLVARYAPAAGHRIPLLFCRSLLRLLRVEVVIEGRRIDDRPALLAANHVSWIDILALGGVTPFCFLAKSEIATWPILSAFAEVQGTVFVDRRRRRSIPAANRQMAARMLEGRSVLLFPEGTTVAAREPGAFRSSHFAAARDLLRLGDAPSRLDVQPIAIAYSSDAAAWVGDDALLPHVWRTLNGGPLRCTISFGTPVVFAADSDRKAVARATRADIVSMLARVRAGQAAAYVDPVLSPAAATGAR